MIRLLRLRIIGIDSTLVRDQRFGIDSCRNGPTDINFRLDGIDIALLHHAVFGDCRIGKHVNLRTSAAHTSKGITRATNVTVATGRIELSTKALRRILTARHVCQTGIVRDVSRLLDKLIRGSVVSTITTAGHFGPAIENELNTEIDIIALTVAGNLDAIGEGGQGTVSPATATVLWNVLIETVGQVGDAIDGTPGKGIG
mmetsp:Transcript_973/g.1605  ORF Transcript_973/g.1605 Transcript_973/m.1605 type:complete len:200 (+) Transcript_973:610-1209(+)